MLAPHLVARLEALALKDNATYFEDELFSDEALTDLEYRSAVLDLYRALDPPLHVWQPKGPRFADIKITR